MISFFGFAVTFLVTTTNLDSQANANYFTPQYWPGSFGYGPQVKHFQTVPTAAVSPVLQDRQNGPICNPFWATCPVGSMCAQTGTQYRCTRPSGTPFDYRPQSELGSILIGGPPPGGWPGPNPMPFGVKPGQPCTNGVDNCIGGSICETTLCVCAPGSFLMNGECLQNGRFTRRYRNALRMG